MTRRIVCVGTFDGVHQGHRALLEELRKEGEALGLKPLVITFSPNPVKVLAPEKPRAFLNSTREKIANLEALGFEVLLMTFDKELAKLTTEAFMQKLKKEHNARAILMGYDHCFGAERSADLSFYQKIGERLDIQVKRAKAYQLEGETASSTLIRNLLRTKRIEQANKLLDYPYKLIGSVQGGMHIGRTLGYPTANIKLDDEDKLLPADGVYAVKVLLKEKQHEGMLYIGKRPTIDKALERTIEVNIFDISADLYTEKIALELFSYIRGEERFDSLEKLKEQIAKDEQAVRLFFANN